MIFNKFISLALAFAASGAVASLTPVRRARPSKSPSSPAPSVSQCNTGTVQCCNTVTSASNLPSLLPNGEDILGELTNSGILSGILGGITNADVPVGLSCTDVVGSSQCNDRATCCNNVQNFGGSLIGINCSPIDVIL
ncbi:hypothetical protein BJV74DRAFT_400386 [Russula compacta]|nr:hypothetical protein BJV74DRAFT_400386 [Russula compacta]